MSIRPQRKFKVLLIGDFCVDVYQFGIIDRLSPEAPVPVFKPTYVEQRDGMAGNVCNNLQTLGCEVDFIRGNTSKKTRLIDQRSRQHIARIDEDVKSQPVKFHTDISAYDAVIISDYAKGSVDYEIIEHILSTVKCPVFIDTKLTDLSRMEGAWVKINALEFSQIQSQCSGLIVTHGSNGADIVRQNIQCPAPSVEVVDVTGAGDTFLAAMAYQYLITQDIKLAVEFANRAAAITVQHLGVYAPTLEEIK